MLGVCVCVCVCTLERWLGYLTSRKYSLPGKHVGFTVPLVARCGMVSATLVTNNLLSVILLFISTGGKGEVCEWHLHFKSLPITSCPPLAVRPLFPGVQMHVTHQAAGASNRNLIDAPSSHPGENGPVIELLHTVAPGLRILCILWSRLA